MLRLSKQANQAIAPMVPELKEFYHVINGEQMGIVELAVELEKQFGNRLNEQVCKTIHISDGACLVLAIGQLRPLTRESLEVATDACEIQKQV